MKYVNKTFTCPAAPAKTTQKQWDAIFAPELCLAFNLAQHTSCHNWEGLHTCMLPKGHKSYHICSEGDYVWSDPCMCEVHVKLRQPLPNEPNLFTLNHPNVITK